MRKRFLVSVSLLLVALLAFGAGMGTMAYFTSEATSQDNVFATGTLKIGVPNEGVNAGFISASNWKPGDSIESTVDVKNLGTLAYKYKVSASMTAGDTLLYNTLTVTIKKGTTVVYNGSLNALADQVVSTDVAAGTTETLSFNVGLPSSAGNAYQGLTSTIKFTFDATQTNNSGWSE